MAAFDGLREVEANGVGGTGVQFRASATNGPPGAGMLDRACLVATRRSQTIASGIRKETMASGNGKAE